MDWENTFGIRKMFSLVSFMKIKLLKENFKRQMEKFKKLILHKITDIKIDKFIILF